MMKGRWRDFKVWVWWRFPFLVRSLGHCPRCGLSNCGTTVVNCREIPKLIQRFKV